MKLLLTVAFLLCLTKIVIADPIPYYGTTNADGLHKAGTVFEEFNGAVKVLYNFCEKPICLDGSNPKGNLVKLPNGSLLGTTATGGKYDTGTIFELDKSLTGTWTEKVLVDFCLYFEHCDRYGRPEGTLSWIDSETLMGTTSRKDGKGVIYIYIPVTKAFNVIYWFK